MEEEAREIFDLRNEANKSFAVNETTIMLCRILQSNRGAGVERRSCRTGTRCSGSSRLPGREALATDLQRGDLQNETCSQVLDWNSSSPNRATAGVGQ